MNNPLTQHNNTSPENPGHVVTTCRCFSLIRDILPTAWTHGGSDSGPKNAGGVCWQGPGCVGVLRAHDEGWREGASVCADAKHNILPVRISDQVCACEKMGEKGGKSRVKETGVSHDSLGYETSKGSVNILVGWKQS